MEILWELIEENLRQLDAGKKASRVLVGTLTPTQLSMLNEKRSSLGFPLVSGEMFFIGSHIYDSRCKRDNYSVDDVLAQLKGALSDSSIIQIRSGGRSTILQSTEYRKDAYENEFVIDEVIFECTSKNPLIEIYSVIPKGDKNKPPKK